MVKTQQKAPVADAAIQLLARWFSCALSNEMLREPIVACGLGRLYNKEAVLELLVSGRQADPSTAHIKSLKVRTSYVTHELGHCHIKSDA